MLCPDCGSNDVIDLGYDDGGGDYGDMITPVHRCQACDSVFDGPGGRRIPPDDRGQDGRQSDQDGQSGGDLPF